MASTFAMVAPVASAAFVNGVEHFDGTIIDTNTWQYAASDGTATQDDRLKLDTSALPSYRGDIVFIENQASVGVGQFVSVEMSMSFHDDPDPISHPIAIDAELSLTTQTTLAVNGPPYTIKLSQQFSPSRATLAGGVAPIGPGASSGTNSYMTTYLGGGSTYRIGIWRLNSTSARYTISTVDGTLLESLTRTLPSYTSPLNVMLAVHSTSATFDNITIGQVPEPMTLMPIGFLAACKLRRSRRAAM